MTLGYHVKLLKLESGERLPVLMTEDGQPLFEPTVYVLTEVRGRNQATNTISSHLRAIQVLYLFLEARNIDFSARLSSGHLLSFAEIEDLARFSRLPMALLESMRSKPPESSQHRLSVFEKVRMKPQTGPPKEVVSTFAGTRLRYIRSYIQWLAFSRLSRPDLNKDVRGLLQSSWEQFNTAIAARIPAHRQGEAQLREGIAPAAREELLRLVSPEAPDNPWRDSRTKYRNQLIIYWLYYLGTRRGELLGVRISDIDFREGTVTIHRRADDPSDPRINQPQAKTRSRKLPLDTVLASLTHAYVVKYRAMSAPAARKHDFLFCADRTGEPLSESSLNKLFKTLRTRCPNLPDFLSPHILRHTWNDRFSERMDEQKTPEDLEKRLRSELMGWVQTSNTAAVYTRRHIRKRAQKVSLEMQEQIMRRDAGHD
jgi:integrase